MRATRKKVAKKKAKKKATKKKSAKKTANGKPKSARRRRTDGGAGLAPRAVKTGRGATPLEVATRMMALLRDGNTAEIEKGLLAPALESVEGVGASMAWRGKKAVLAKYRAWESDHEIHDMQVDGPWVGATGFAVKYAIDVTQISTGQRTTMEEIAVYTVHNGKIVREEFHFRI